MKLFKYTKSLITIIGVCMSMVACKQTAQAATTNFVVTANATNIVFDQGVNISSVKLITGANTGSPSITFYDNNTNSITYTNAAYTNYTTVNTNVTSIITNSQGFLQTNIYPGQWTYASSVAANTNNLPVILSLAAPANSSTISYANLVTSKGFVARASTAAITNCILQIIYEFSYSSP